MKYITVTLTEQQTLYFIHHCWIEIDKKRPQSDPYNAFVIRLANKLAKALALAKQS